MEHHDEKKVDEELYSRQLYVIGHEAMLKIMSVNALIIGLDGLGQEIAKNICLTGLNSVSLYDKNPVTIHSLGSGYFFSKDSIGQNRDRACLKRLKDLNKYVKVKIAEEMDLDNYQVVVSVNQTIQDNLKLNDACHSKKIKFIMANASGLFTQLFCDFQEHICCDSNGEPPITGAINDITIDGLLTLVSGSSHNLENGDTVKIKDSQYKIKVINRNQFQLIDYKADSLKVGGDFEQVKIPFSISFKSLRKSLEEPEIMDFDFSDKVKAIHDLFTTGKTEDKHKSLEDQFVKTKGCLIAPICSIIGGIAAQEVVKAASSKFVPFKQFYYFESTDSYIGSNGEEKEYINSRYFDLVKIYGGEGFEKIKKMKIFLVGSGAIGCENIKNFVMSGLCANGRLTVTDMDSIEQSNLNRQFLFRQEDVQKMKSDSAVKHALELNEDFASEPTTVNSKDLATDVSKIDISGNLVSLTVPVKQDTETTFSDKFLQEQDLVANALDNVEARAYMDRRCVQMRKPLIDAGTLGTKGHVQVIIPFVSETYGSSEDPEDKSIPLCTIKSFPYSIEHTIEWAMGEFRAQFSEKVSNVKDYLTTKDPALEEEFNSTPKSVEGCLRSALALFVNYFSTSITKLLSSFGPDHVDKDGNLFWAPPKRIPSPIAFNINDKIHVSFVISCANLYAECFGIRRITSSEVYAYLENVLSIKEPKSLSFGDKEVDFSTLSPIEFDKDSWHVDFVHAAANLRARNYTIKERSKHFIRGIAGRIVPAIATTTAVVSGLSTLEILKYTTKGDDRLKDSEKAKECILNSKNSYLDLAVPFVASTDLMPPKTSFLKVGCEKIKFNTWSRLELPDGILTSVIETIEKKAKIEVSMVSIGARVIYWNLSNKYDGNKIKTIAELCNKKPGQTLVYLDILPEDPSDSLPGAASVSEPQNDCGEMMDVAIMFDQ